MRGRQQSNKTVMRQTLRGEEKQIDRHMIIGLKVGKERKDRSIHS